MTTVVVRVDGGSTLRLTADVVVVSCGAVNSAALLLRSANDKHPRGLANSSDVVGRHYMRHNNVAVIAVSKEPNPTRFQKTLAMNDWYSGADDFDYPLGGIQMLGKSDADQVKAGAPRWAAAGVARDAVRGARPPRRRFLAVRRGPAGTGQPGHPRQGGPDPSRRRREEQRRRREPAPAQARGHARRPRDAQAQAARPQHLPAQGPSDRRDRPPGRDGALRFRSGQLGTRPRPARRTTWTTSTSSTPASSRASAR